MRGYQYDHVHLRSPDPDATARFFETMFGAEVARSVYPPGTLYPGQQRIAMRLGGQKVLIAPPHPHEPNVSAPPFPHYGLEHTIPERMVETANGTALYRGSGRLLKPRPGRPQLAADFTDTGEATLDAVVVKLGRSPRQDSHLVIADEHDIFGDGVKSIRPLFTEGNAT